MEITCKQDSKACGDAAAEEGIKQLKQLLAAKEEVNVILATGLSQFALLAKIVATDGIAWERVNAFHLDEYIGLPIRHPASFRGILWREFAAKLPVPLKSFTWIDGESDPAAECDRLARLISDHPIDLAFVGIGENGHLAFNDPPADFKTERPYIVVELDEACRRQQMGEGWFKTIADVPGKAISMSIRQIMKSKSLIITTPDARKAEAVKNTLEKEISNQFPASIMRTHPQAKLYLDANSASKLAGMTPGSVKTIPVEKAP